jgi:hypothetical protein
MPKGIPIWTDFAIGGNGDQFVVVFPPNEIVPSWHMMSRTASGKVAARPLEAKTRGATIAEVKELLVEHGAIHMLEWLESNPGISTEIKPVTPPSSPPKQYLN